MKKIPLRRNFHGQKEKLGFSEYLIIFIVTLSISVLSVAFIVLIFNFLLAVLH